MDEKRQPAQLRRATRQRDRSHAEPDGSLQLRQHGLGRLGVRASSGGKAECIGLAPGSALHAALSARRAVLRPAPPSRSSARSPRVAVPQHAHTSRSARADRGIDVCRPAELPCAKPNQGTGRPKSSTKPRIPRVWRASSASPLRSHPQSRRYPPSSSPEAAPVQRAGPAELPGAAGDDRTAGAAAPQAVSDRVKAGRGGLRRRRTGVRERAGADHGRRSQTRRREAAVATTARRQALSAASSRSGAPQDRACAAACNSLISRPWFQ